MPMKQALEYGLYGTYGTKDPVVPVALEIKHYKPGLFHLVDHPTERAVRKNRFLWWGMTLGRYEVYYAVMNGKVVHHSYVVPKCMRFPFLKRRQYVICSSNTDASCRGMGVFPQVLSRILQDYGTEAWFYAMIADDNHASIRGTAKVGFTYMGRAEQSKRHIWKIMPDRTGAEVQS